MLEYTSYVIGAGTMLTLFSQGYLKRKADPKVFDSIDLQIELNALNFDEMSKAECGEPSAAICERVVAARKIQE